MAVDDDVSTYWASIGECDPQWIYIDLGTTATINRVVLNWGTEYGKGYEIQISDDAGNWMTVVTETNGDGDIDDITGLSANGRYVRMYGTACGKGKGYMLREFKLYGTSGSGEPTTKHTVTSVRPSSGLRAGLRSSLYGLKPPFPDPDYWVDAASSMASRFDDSVPAVVWIVGEIDFPETCRLNFPSPGGTYSNISFHNIDRNEAYLDLFDQTGVKVWLQVEPVDADMSTLIDLILQRYASHPSVIGFGVDVEWHKWSSDEEGVAALPAACHVSFP